MISIKSVFSLLIPTDENETMNKSDIWNVDVIYKTPMTCRLGRVVDIFFYFYTKRYFFFAHYINLWNEKERALISTLRSLLN